MMNYLAIALIRNDDISRADALCDALCDDIISETLPFSLSRFRATHTAIFAIARIFDRTESHHAAHLRDAIRTRIDDF